MTVLTFPSSPIEGQVYNAPTGVRYVYDGVKWVVETVTSTSEAVTNSTQDRVAPMFVTGDHTGITFSYDAATNTMSADVTSVNGDRLINGTHELVLGADGNITAPAFTIPNAVGTTGQVLKWPSSGTTLVWGADTAGSTLGDLQVAETEGIFNRITGTELGTGIVLDVEESAADVLGGAVFLSYNRHVDSVDPNTGSSHLAVTPYGIEVSTNNSSWQFKHNGSLAFNNNEVYIATNNWGITAPVEASTVVYTQKSINDLASIRVHATIEGVEDGDTTGNHSQACDMMIVRRVANGGISTVDSVVYGVIYTGIGPLATLDAQWNAVTNKIEITATPVSTTNNVYVKIYATEVARGD